MQRDYDSVCFLQAESKRSENVESNSEPPLEFKYYDKDEVDKQVQLWIEEDKKYPWKDAPPKVKVIIANQQIYTI